jgi:TRAP-type mannitol/chloroaromatic compound transport system permease small subunit
VFRRLNQGLNVICSALAFLVVPLAFLLFAQWPLRDWLGSGSRPANDLAQCIFALYVAVAIRYASAQRGHFATQTFSARYSLSTRRTIERFGHTLAVLPFALFVLFKGSTFVWFSIRSLESFPDTFNPGYFLIKIAAWLLAFLMALQAAVELFERTPFE